MKNNSSSRTGLFLMELIIAVLFFSLAGAICIRLFVQSHIISEQSVELNHSVLWAQNVAETFYGCNGNTGQMTELLENSILETENGEQDMLTMVFDENFDPVPAFPNEDSADSHPYRLQASISEDAGLMVCNIYINAGNELIYSLKVSLFPDKEAADEQ